MLCSFSVWTLKVRKSFHLITWPVIKVSFWLTGEKWPTVSKTQGHPIIILYKPAEGRRPFQPLSCYMFPVTDWACWLVPAAVVSLSQLTVCVLHLSARSALNGTFKMSTEMVTVWLFVSGLIRSLFVVWSSPTFQLILTTCYNSA